MQFLLDLIAQHGLLIVFVNVLLVQLGVPLPAYPTLIAVGALVGAGAFSPVAVVAVAVLGSVIADLAWYAAGARAGRRVLGLMCRLSLSPDGCVRQSETIFARYGAPSLMVAKFVPGFAAIATTMAGVVHVRLLLFVLFDAIGAALWAGTGMALGWLFRDAVADVLAVLEQSGRIGLGVLAAALAGFVALKAWRRRQFREQLRMPRIDVDALAALLQGDRRTLVLDVRMRESHAERRIPGARWIDLHAPQAIEDLPAADEVVVVCACPGDASAALFAKRLLARGVSNVRPLRGGIDAWMAAGRPLEGDGVAGPVVAPARAGQDAPAGPTQM